MNKTAAAQPAKITNSLKPAQSLLQRNCACGNHTPAGEKCAGCAKEKSRLQRRLAIGASNDPLEHEADRVAEQVMSTPLNSAVNATPPRIQRLSGQTDRGANTAPASVDKVLAGSGRPLEPALQLDMEQRFGHDFSHVRVHIGGAAEQSARDVNAHAYTVGSNIVFGAGQFSPGSQEGRKLLAHELTHSIQQKTCGINKIQRKIQVDPGVQLDTLGYTTTKSGDTYTCPKVVKTSIFHEIFTGLLNSVRTFILQGASADKANASLHKQMNARIGIVEFASKKKYTFGAGSNFAMNPDFWVVDHAAGNFDVKPGVNRKDAINDLNVHPSKYTIACKAATYLTMEGGGKSPLRFDTSSSDTDWIPGDWGYIKNTSFPAVGGQAGLEGENIIYVGKDKFWGHFGPGLEYKTLQEWVDSVKHFQNPAGGAVITDSRKYPYAGLR